jgi:hypothetical protein
VYLNSIIECIAHGYKTERIDVTSRLSHMASSLSMKLLPENRDTIDVLPSGMATSGFMTKMAKSTTKDNCNCIKDQKGTYEYFLAGHLQSQAPPCLY